MYARVCRRVNQEGVARWIRGVRAVGGWAAVRGCGFDADLRAGLATGSGAGAGVCVLAEEEEPAGVCVGGVKRAAREREWCWGCWSCGGVES